MNVDQKLIAAMIEEFKKYPAIEKILLFGSRARGDYQERSDYDIAVFGVLSRTDMARLHLTFDDELPTLHKIDLIFTQNNLPEKFRHNIETEGVKIYG